MGKQTASRYFSCSILIIIMFLSLGRFLPDIKNFRCFVLSARQYSIPVIKERCEKWRINAGSR